MGDEFWKKLLDSVGKISPSAEMLLKSSKFISLNEKSLRLGVFYKFHKERIEDLRNRKIFEDTIFEILRKKVDIECILCEQSRIDSDLEKYNLVEPGAMKKIQKESAKKMMEMGGGLSGLLSGLGK